MAKIVVIEDEQILRELIVNELEKSDHQVFAAVNGQTGWELIREEVPDIILLDLLMPVMSGYDVLSLMQDEKKFKDIPCIVISNSGQNDDLNRAYSLGAKAVLIKAEFNPDQLVEKIEAILKEQKQTQN